VGRQPTDRFRNDSCGKLPLSQPLSSRLLSTHFKPLDFGLANDCLCQKRLFIQQLAAM
jgi:hypothetical protein